MPSIIRWQAGRADHPGYDDREARPARQHDAEGVVRPGTWPTVNNDNDVIHDKEDVVGHSNRHGLTRAVGARFDVTAEPLDHTCP